MMDFLEVAKNSMNKVVLFLEDEYKKIRSGKANPAILDEIKIDYHKVQTPISQIASVSTVEACVLVIHPWDSSVLGEIEKAIQKANSGGLPQNDGKIVRVIFPPLTEERRKELAKEISKIAENAKIAVRNVRRDVFEKIKAMKKKGEISEDEVSSEEKKVQNFTNVSVAKIDLLKDSKTKQIMEI
jgi:ribosome recycling factor